MGKVPDIRENADRCVCPDCPTKPADDKTLYCARGKSPTDVRQRGCLCGDCPLTPDYRLTRSYYCVEGVTE
jgi:hypothetical protein